MASSVFRRISVRLPESASRFRSASRYVCSRYSGFCSGTNNRKPAMVDEDEVASMKSINNPSSFAGDGQSRSPGFGVETMDDDTWHVSSSLAQAWRELHADKRGSFAAQLPEDETVDKGDIDPDEIDNLRIHGNLFYKIDRGSKEFEEYSFDFHRKKHLKTKKDEIHEEARKKDTGNTKEACGERKKKNDQSHESASTRVNPFSGEFDNPNAAIKKKERTPTFNQVTAPYHYPFCLDIYISKASVRASVIHRVTSKVVAVAHSISKDIKFDMGSTRNAATCAAVGRILAQRALEDDIHDVIYTPRKGENLEGKLQIVLQAVVENGVNVKVKLKQRKLRRTNLPVITQKTGAFTQHKG